MQQAKAQLSELVRCAETEGPQDITLHGRAVDFMQASPLTGLHEELVFDRDNSLTRDVSLLAVTGCP